MMVVRMQATNAVSIPENPLVRSNTTVTLEEEIHISPLKLRTMLQSRSLIRYITSAGRESTNSFTFSTYNAIPYDLFLAPASCLPCNEGCGGPYCVR